MYIHRWDYLDYHTPRKEGNEISVIYSDYRAALLSGIGGSTGRFWRTLLRYIVWRSALLLARMIWVVDLEDGTSCSWAFGPGSGYVGTAISAGFLAD